MDFEPAVSLKRRLSEEKTTKKSQALGISFDQEGRVVEHTAGDLDATLYCISADIVRAHYRFFHGGLLLQPNRRDEDDEIKSAL